MKLKDVADLLMDYIRLENYQQEWAKYNVIAVFTTLATKQRKCFTKQTGVKNLINIYYSKLQLEFYK